MVINARNPDKLAQAIEQFRQAGLDATGFLFDIADPESIKQSIIGIEETIGPIDILVNNAGIIRRAPAEDLDEADWNDVMGVLSPSNTKGRLTLSSLVVGSGEVKINNNADADKIGYFNE